MLTQHTTTLSKERAISYCIVALVGREVDELTALLQRCRFFDKDSTAATAAKLLVSYSARVPRSAIRYNDNDVVDLPFVAMNMAYDIISNDLRYLNLRAVEAGDLMRGLMLWAWAVREACAVVMALEWRMQPIAGHTANCVYDFINADPAVRDHRLWGYHDLERVARLAQAGTGTTNVVIQDLNEHLSYGEAGTAHVRVTGEENRQATANMARELLLATLEDFATDNPDLRDYTAAVTAAVKRGDYGDLQFVRHNHAAAYEALPAADRVRFAGDYACVQQALLSFDESQVVFLPGSSTPLTDPD